LEGCEVDYDGSCKYGLIACDNNEADGCNHASNCYLTGFKDTKADINKTIKYLDKSCKLGSGMGCYAAWKNYYFGQSAQEYPDNPNKLEINYEKAFHYAKEACNYGNYSGCHNARLMCLRGEGTPKNPKLAYEFNLKGQAIKSDYKDAQPVVFGEQHTKL
jgi:uncharacterized protein